MPSGPAQTDVRAAARRVKAPDTAARSCAVGRRRRHSRGSLAAFAAAAAGALASSAAWSRPPNLAGIGYFDLVARIGASNVPTGEGVIVAQVEASAMVGLNAYIPDPGRPQFVNVDFFPQTLPAVVSTHAFNVGVNIYGTTSPAPGVKDVYLWLADHWIADGLLHTGEGSGTPPSAPPGGVRLFNHSWIGTTMVPALNDEAMRRADLLGTRENVLIIAAAGSAQNPMLGNTFNGLIVGSTPATSGYTTPGSHEAPGRTKPDIVAPTNSKSEGTGLTSGVAAALFETADAMPDSGVAARIEVMKACMMAGAVHRPEWTNGAPATGESRGVATRPLDANWGADTLNIDRAHLVLTGGRRAGAPSPAWVAPAQRAGWDLASIETGASMYYRFRTTETTDEAIISAAWSRRVESDMASYTLADFDLEFWRVDPVNGLVPMTGAAGEPYFTGGNVASRSAIDNVEHLRILGLAQGDYMLEVRRRDTLPGGAWDIALAWLRPRHECPGDANGDNLVNFADLNIVLANYGAVGQPGAVPGDVNGDGRVTFSDLNLVLSYFSASC